MFETLITVTPYRYLGGVELRVDRLVHHAEVVSLKGGSTGSRTKTWGGCPTTLRDDPSGEGGQFSTGGKGINFRPLLTPLLPQRADHVLPVSPTNRPARPRRRSLRREMRSECAAALTGGASEGTVAEFDARTSV